MELTRRSLLAGAAAAAPSFVLPSSVTAASQRRRLLLREGAFDCGVMAGSPGMYAITLWTHVGGLDREAWVRLEIASDPGFSRVVERRLVRVAPVRDYTARATIRSSRALRPGQEYFYRFATRSGSSPVGRFVTARPPDSREPLRIGFFSCQKWTSGLYTAHRGLAAEKDLDLVVCLGDYIYEGGGKNEEIGRVDTVGSDGQAQTLAEYREKYRLYLSDEHLRAMHASAPFMGIWDDHEAENNYAGESSGSLAASKRRAEFLTRRRNGYLAFFEYGPRNRLRAEPMRIYGRLPLGGLADLFLLDTRQYRDDQAGCPEVEPCPDAKDRSRTMLGEKQREWLKKSLGASRATWKVVANQVMMMALEGVPGFGLNPDQWDGYPGDRAGILSHVRSAGVTGTTVITGDIHTFFAGDVYPEGRADGARPAAVEFVGGSITSGGLEERLPPGSIAAAEAGAVAANTPHLKYAQLTRRGYGVLELRPDELTATFRSPTSVTDAAAKVEDLAKFRVALSDGLVERTG